MTLAAARADAGAERPADAGTGPGTRLVRGQSVFVPHGTGAVVVDGEGDVVVAYVP
ncbi:hypothetical protein G8C93_11390 [Cellulosimicrobium cellulans]|nr:hypothetical protein [Cellulosimicrobium cellulans]